MKIRREKTHAHRFCRISVYALCWCESWTPCRIFTGHVGMLRQRCIGPVSKDVRVPGIRYENGPESLDAPKRGRHIADTQRAADVDARGIETRIGHQDGLGRVAIE